MRKLSEIKAFEDEFELFEMDAARVIGKAVRSGGQQGKQAELLWGEVMGTKVHEQLVALPDVIADSLVGYMCEEQADGSVLYILGALAPAGTAVPEGMEYRDIPACVVAKGLFGDELTDTVTRAREAGYDAEWPPFTWSAELFVLPEDEQVADTNVMPRHWLIPVKKA